MKRIGAISAIVLAGGAGRRMGGLDKGLQRFRGRTLVESVLERIAPQVDEVLVSANRNLESYRRLGFPVLPDEAPAGRGPLAGIQAGLRAARHPWLLTLPCDAPHLPLELALRLKNALEPVEAQCAVASVGGRREPVFALVSRGLAGRLDDYLAAGGRAVHEWQRSVDAIEVDFDDDARAFAQLNTLAALTAEAPRGG